MATVIKMPKLSDTMETGTIVNWLKKEGDAVKSGEAIAEVESDKATLELETYESGILRKVLVKANESAPLFAPLAIIADSADENIDELLASVANGGGAKEVKKEVKPAADKKDENKEAKAESEKESKKDSSEAKPAAAKPAAPEKDGEPDAAFPNSGGERVMVSPVAARMAMEEGFDLKLIKGSGPKGRIVLRDVEKAKAEGMTSTRPVGIIPYTPLPVGDAAAGEEYQDVANSSMRRTIAQRLTESKSQIPHYYLTIDVNMDQAVELRKQLNALEGMKISINDFVIKAAAMALRKNPAMNSSYQGGHTRVYNRIDIGVAVAMEDGLITPVVRNANLKGLHEISQNVRALAERARAKKLKTDEFTGSTFTISNLGMFGIKHFTAIINPPEAGILAVGAVNEVPTVRDGVIVVGSVMNVTLSSDHRVVDGAQSAQFLSDFKYFIENPITFAL